MNKTFPASDNTALILLLILISFEQSLSELLILSIFILSETINLYESNQDVQIVITFAKNKN